LCFKRVLNRYLNTHLAQIDQILNKPRFGKNINIIFMGKEMEQPGQGIKYYSKYAEKHKKEMERIAMLQTHVEALQKSAKMAEAAGHSEAAARNREEIRVLENEILGALHRANDNKADEHAINEFMNDLGPDQFGHA